MIHCARKETMVLVYENGAKIIPTTLYIPVTIRILWGAIVVEVHDEEKG